MSNIKLVKGDANFPISFTIKDAEGDPVNLANLTSITLKCQRYGTSAISFEVDGRVTGEATGKVEFDVTDEIASISGDYYGEIEIIWSGGKKLTCPDIHIKIIKDLPRT